MLALTVALRRGALDRALAAGADPGSTPALTTRALQLSAGRSRSALAAALVRMVDSPPAGLLRSRAAVRANRDRMVELAQLLHSSQPLYVTGLAEIRLLLSDGCGALYTDARGEALAAQLQLIGRLLRGEVRDPVEVALPMTNRGDVRADLHHALAPQPRRRADDQEQPLADP
jgi:hypothetical protein